MIPYGLFYGYGWQDSLARDAHEEAMEAASDARHAVTLTDEVVHRVERLALMSQALWSLLRDRLGVTDEELMDVAKDLDLSDGYRDGRVRHASRKCPSCHRMVGKHHLRCIYCGTLMPREPFSGE
jgi:hypothetical protein